MTTHGKYLKAYVVLKGGVKGSNKMGPELITSVQKRKARHEWITGGVTLVPDIPKSANGKIITRLLRDRSKNGYADDLTAVMDEVTEKAKL